MKASFFLLACCLFIVPAHPAIGSAQSISLDFDGAMVAASGDPQARSALEAECLAILSADTDWTDRYRALRTLAGIASPAAVPHLAALLDDPNLSHLARVALETLPYPEAVAALRDALTVVSGPRRVGIISSLAHRRDAEAVPALTGLLQDADAAVQDAAASALGSIATPEAIAALWATSETEEEPLRLSRGRALLAAADRLIQDGHASAGLEVCQRLLAGDDWPDFIRAGAFNGILAADPSKAADRVQEAIQGDLPLFQVMGIAAVTRLDGAGITDRFAALLPALAPEHKALLLDALAEREDAVSLAVVHDALKSDDAGVRMSAMRTLSTRGDASSVAPLCDLLAAPADRQEKLAVIETLRRLEGLEIDETILARLREGTPELAADLLDVLAQRNAVHLVDPIFEQLQRAPVRPAAFRALGHLAQPADMKRLMDALALVEGDHGRLEAETALVTLAQRSAQQEGNLLIHKAVYGDLPAGPQADVTRMVADAVEGGSLSIQACNTLFGDPAPNIAKKLLVSYTLNGVPGEVLIAEGETLNLAADTLTQTLATLFSTAIEQAYAPSAVSLMRVLSRLGGQAAFEMVNARLDHIDAAVRNGAIRALAAWPDAVAIEALSELFASGLDPSLRTLVLRGCVRLLQTAALGPGLSLGIYERLADASPSVEELRIILSGLAQLNTPPALVLVQSFLDKPEVRAEALSALQRLTGTTTVPTPTAETSESEEGFVAIFNGTDLSGWSGEPGLWRVENGLLVGETTADAPIAQNTFLCWEGGEPADFELKFRYRIESDWANSGIQIRSERFEGHRVRGYQPDIASEDWISGICFEEAGRGILARRGQSVTLAAEGEKETAQFAEEQALGAHIHPRDWNEYHIIARGDHFVSMINGHVMHEVTDTAPEARRSGILAFQLHTGPPMKIVFSDIRLKTLTANTSE